MVRDFHTVIGREARRQVRAATGRGPDYLLACVGGGSNAIGLFHPFIGDRAVRIVGVEAGGHGLASGRHGASLCAGRVGVLHGSMSYLLQDEDGQVATAHSISAGLDYPGVGPELAYYKDTGRFEFVSITDEEALAAFESLARLEGIMPALESAHAVAHAMKLAQGLPRRRRIVVGLSGRGDQAIPLVFLTYYNPVLAFGLKAFARSAVDAGLDGVIVADLPPEEAGPLADETTAAGLDLIHLVAPTSTPARMRRIAQRSRGFVYVVSLTGVTGVRDALPPDLLTQQIGRAHF